MWAYVINLAVLISHQRHSCGDAEFHPRLRRHLLASRTRMFFGVGAYTAALCRHEVRPPASWSATAAGMALAALISLALALPALRVRGEYFVAASLGLQMLAITVFTEWKSVTGGIGGLTDIPPARLFGFAVTQPEHFLLLSLGCLALIMLVIRALVRSSFGRSLKAIRDDETAACGYGKNVAIIKTTAVVVSSALAAVAGSLYAFYLSFINVESFVLDTSIQLMAMVIIGGTATLFGPVIGAVLILLLPGRPELPAVPARHRDRLDPADRLRAGDGAVDDLPAGRPLGVPGRPRAAPRAARHEPGRRDFATGERGRQDLRRPQGRRCCFVLAAQRHHHHLGGAEWSGQDHAVQPDDRAPAAGSRRGDMARQVHCRPAALEDRALGYRPFLSGPQAFRQHDGGRRTSKR